MHWIQISLQTTREKLADVEETLNQRGAVAITYGDAADQPLFEPDPGETPLWDTVLLQGLFAADQDIAATLDWITKAHPLVSPPKAEIVEDKDWSKEWMQHFKPIQCGAHLWICPSWLKPPYPDKVNLMLDPGMAFGTGTHPTTHLCLKWLDQHAATEPDFHSYSLIDYGCGSGILAIAALLLGCQNVWATDIDPLAIESTQYNARRNSIESSRLVCGLVDQVNLPSADILIANILAGPLVELAPVIVECCRPQGHLVLSGLLESQIEETMKAYQSWFEFSDPVTAEGWVLLHGVRSTAEQHS